MTIGRFPPEIISCPLQFVFTFIMPIFIMVAFPVKAYLGLLSFEWMLFAFVYTFGFLGIAYWFWKGSVNKYSSASS